MNRNDSPGRRLKQSLGLSKFPYVRIRRLIAGTSIPLYQICFDSRNPQRVLTSYMLNSVPTVPFVASGYAERIYGTPFIDIDNWLGEQNGKLFILCDLSGVYGKKDNYDFLIESTKSESKLLFQLDGQLLEYITLPALTDKQANVTSNLTKKFKDIRKDVQKTANVNTKLITTELEGNDVVFRFLTEATNAYGPDHKYGQVNPSTKEIEPNPSKTYEIWIKLLNVVGDNGWIKAFDPESETLTQKDIKDILDVSYVQIWSNAPSFHWQGMNFNNSQLDSAIFPTDIAPKQWNKKHGDGEAFLDKHLSQLIDQLPFFRNQMASALTNLLRKEKIIPRRK